MNSEGFIIGAYAASPTFSSWNESLENQFLSKIASLPNLRGLEVPIHANGNVHR